MQHPRFFPSKIVEAMIRVFSLRPPEAPRFMWGERTDMIPVGLANLSMG